MNQQKNTLSNARSFIDAIDAKLLGIQKDIKYYDAKKGEMHPRHLAQIALN